MEGQLLVTPEVLESTAGEFSNVMSQISNLTENMVSQVNGLASVWQGEASTAYVTKFNQLNDDIQKMHSMIQEHVTDLTEMAATYREAESVNEQSATALSGDVIV